MSLSLRFGAVASLQETLGNQKALPMDERLRELKEKVEESGEAPFMIDNGTILKAVPKKKMSRARRRKKLYAPANKQVHPINNIVRCSACGSVKRSHFMCMNCFAEIRTFLKSLKRNNGLIKDKVEAQTDLDPTVERVVYPGKFESEEKRKLKSKDYVPKREEAPMFNHLEVRKPKKKKGPVMVRLE
ncbi:54S ribosomal protein L32, mitochondrial [Candida viswanathii]|uniref:Large ribosomal subunit protein bL32m n=1 Tax=Candida viswanathii TaxID=5486 RepID=A0A367Y9D4_9ASCO|nr:54S ribosomal protein L32, mitochondrial [Candida viswanathii]